MPAKKTPPKPAGRPKAKAKAAAPGAKRAAAKAKPKAKAPAARPPLDYEVAMRPVAAAPAPPPAPQTRAERLAAHGHPMPVAGAGRPPRPPRRFRLRNLFASSILAGFVIAAVVLALPAVSQGNTGTIKVHDGAGADPDERNEPHVAGDAWVEGFNMAADGGDLLFYHWPPTGDMELVLDTTWEADDGTPEFHFLAGPFALPCGHYRVFAYNGDGPEDPTVPDEGGAKKKSFWVDCAEAPAMECPNGLVAVANPDGSVTLFWNDAPGSDGTNIYRATDGGEFEYLDTAVPEAESYSDPTAVPGTSYEYSVTALYGESESRQCPVVEVTAIPEFPTAVGLGLATAGGALALMLRRRKA